MFFKTLKNQSWYINYIYIFFLAATHFASKKVHWLKLNFFIFMEDLYYSTSDSKIFLQSAEMSTLGGDKRRVVGESGINLKKSWQIWGTGELQRS